jgi:putative ABC transport system permease protein
MLRHFLVTTWRILGANKLQSAIAIFGLSLGLAAAILDGLVVANQLSFDHFIPGHENLYFVAMKDVVAGPVSSAPYTLHTPPELGRLVAQANPQVQETARLDSDFSWFRHGQLASQESLYWADANIFHLLPLPVLYGNLATALARPDGIVLPVSMARKYFGRDNALGETITFGLRHPHDLTVTAVIADLPVNASNLQASIFVSGKAAFSGLAKDDLDPPMGANGGISLGPTTLMRIAPAAVPGVQARATALVQSRVHLKGFGPMDVHLVRLDRAHAAPELAPRVGALMGIFTLVAALVLFLGCANFVNISTARAARRSVEVGIRKVAGASRTALALQFVGEGIIQALVALCVAIMITELSLPSVNEFLQTGAVFDYWRDPVLAASLLAGAVLVGALAGIYPAMVLSAFQPAVVLKGLILGVGRTVLIRQLLVGLQFVILILLIAAAIIMSAQYDFSIREALRVNTDQIIFVRDQKCETPFEAAIRTLPGVRADACSSTAMLPELFKEFGAKRHNARPMNLHLVSVGYGVFELYGLRPLAGRFFSRAHGGDAVPPNPPQGLTAHYVINETAMRQLGFASPQAAIGQPVAFDQPPPTHDAPAAKPAPEDSISGEHFDGDVPGRKVLDGIVIGVVPDFSLFPSDASVPPIAYSVGWPLLSSVPEAAMVHIRLSGRALPETLEAIDRLWRRTNGSIPVQRAFLDSYIGNLVVAMLREGQAFAIFAGIAVLLACLGLFALSIAAAERRTKEIGIRKAMGASSTDIVLLLLWQFLKPVLWAVVIAVPLAWVVMQRWLSGYAYHVMPGPWPYLAAAALGVAIGVATVITHAILTARAVPATALRYE